MRASSKPHLACEILPGRVIAARAGQGRSAVEIYTSRALPGGALAPSLASANVSDPGALRQAVADALAAVAGRSRDVIAILPDAAVRLFLLDFDALPDRAQEADAVVRFRLRKSLPFDVEQAQLSYSVRRNSAAVHVVAAVAMASVVAEYEAAFRDAGYNPGVVLPSMLAALGTVEASGPTLVAKVDPATVTVAIAERDTLRLMRTLENPFGVAIDGKQLADEIHPSLVFFQDAYGGSIERVLISGVASLPQVASALETQAGIPVEPLVSSRSLGTSLSGDQEVAGSLAGVVGALLG